MVRAVKSYIFFCIQGFLTFLLGPLLPERYRKTWPWPDLMGLQGLQTWHGFFWAFGAAILWFVGLIAYQKEMAEVVTAIVASDSGSGDVGAITHYGLVTFFAYFFTVHGALLTVLLLDGVARGAAGAMTGRVPGSVYLAGPLGLIRLVGIGLRAQRMTSLYGKSSEPDRVGIEGGVLKVRRTRPHPEWNADLAYRFGDKLYRLHNYDDHAFAQGRPCFEYQFTPWPEGTTLRRVVDIPDGRRSIEEARDAQVHI